jgi:type VI secretion system secreted protein VgrG
MPTITQEKRELQLETPLGKDVLLLSSFAGQESLSQLFHYQLDLFSQDTSIKAKDIVGKAVTWSVHGVHSEPRFFCGMVSRFVAAGPRTRDKRAYRAEVVPWLWFLTRTANCRIFQNKSVPQIIESIFKELGFASYQFKLTGSYKPRDYCVQYRETAFKFISRLMEFEGIFYYFHHEQGKHTVVLGDSKTAFEKCDEDEVEYFSGTLARNSINAWEHQYLFGSGKLAHTDYNFETPETKLLTNTQTVVDLPGITKYEVFDYPGGYMQSPAGSASVKIRMQEEEAGHDTVAASSTCCTFTPGGTFKLTARECPDEEDTYVITSVQHSGTNPSYQPGSAGSSYQNTFTCMPASVPYRPARVTPRPIVQGVQTAVVVGPGGSEIYTDKYGRVKVQFYWDREGKSNENSSCWIRVSENWAGKNWGVVFNPRIGQEVIVDFLEGDPDRPLITGRVYNAMQMPPYPPGNNTMSTLKTRSSPGGGAANFNEVRFEDKAGAEQLFIHAERNQDIEVEKDETHWVGHDRSKKIDHDEMLHVEHDRTEYTGHDRSLEVIHDKTEKIGNNKSISVAAVHAEKIGADMIISVGSTLTETVAINYAETVGGAMQLSVGGLLAITVGAALAETVGLEKSETIGAAKSENIGGNRSLDVGGDATESVKGNQTVEISKDFKEEVGGQHTETVKKEYSVQAKKIQLVADEEINIKTGKAEIVMKKNGDITIQGNKITVKGDGDIIIKGSKIKEN